MVSNVVNVVIVVGNVDAYGVVSIPLNGFHTHYLVHALVAINVVLDDIKVCNADVLFLLLLLLLL